MTDTVLGHLHLLRRGGSLGRAVGIEADLSQDQAQRRLGNGAAALAMRIVIFGGDPVMAAQIGEVGHAGSMMGPGKTPGP